MNEPHLTNEQLIDYVHGELTAEGDALVHAHLATCGACSDAREAEARLGELLRKHAAAEERDFPPGLVLTIREAVLRDGAPSWQRRLSALLRPAIAVPAAAALALAVYFGFASQHASVRTASIDAAYFLEDHAALATTTPFGEGGAIPVAFTSDVSTTDGNTGDASH